MVYAGTYEEEREEVTEEFGLEKRLDYAREIPGAEEIKNEYIQWEQSKESRERERLYIYRKSGKLVLTWGWFMEALQKEPGTMAEDIDRKVLEIISKYLKKNLEQNPKLYQTMLTTIVFTLFVYPVTNNMGRLSQAQHRMLERLQEKFPYLWDDICEHPGVISQMQCCEEIPYDFGIYCMKKWKEDSTKEQEIGKFLRYGKFWKEHFGAKEQPMEHLAETVSFLESYTKESRALQESYAFRLMAELPDNVYIWKRKNMFCKSKEDHFFYCVKEQLEKLEKKGIPLLENCFHYKNSETTWNHRDMDKINTFLTMWERKEHSLRVEEIEEYVEKNGIGSNLDIILERCRIEIQDKAKVYLFQIAVGLNGSEEDMVKYYRKNLFPKEMIPKLISKLRKEKKIEKIPLLLQWMYEEEEDVYS